MKIDNPKIAKEHDFLEKVLNFSFQIGGSTICFNQIADRVELDLTVPSDFVEEIFDLEKLTKRKELLQAEINELEPVVQSWQKELRIPMYHGLPLSCYIDLLQNVIVTINDCCNNNGILRTSKLGCFNSIEEKVCLYLDNIENAVTINVQREVILIKTFIHEMFHAWNYFACGGTGKTVREIDEAMVEFATLCFLKQISQKHSEFRSIMSWAKQNIKEKQTAIGNVVAYGYGYYLFSLTNSDKQSLALNLLKAYDKKSGKISPSSCNDVMEKLNPIYPFDEEDQLFDMLRKLLIHKYKASVKNEEIRATLQEYFDSKKSELDAFSDLIEGHRVVVKIINGQISVEVSQAIDTSNRGSSH